MKRQKTAHGGRLGKAIRVKRGIRRLGFFELLETSSEFLGLLACKIALAVFATVRSRMIAVCAGKVVRMRSDTPMAGFPRVRVA